jgi:hypothetical protein
MVSHTCDPSYMEGHKHEDHSLSTALSETLRVSETLPEKITKKQKGL